jgi:50S ribosomal subunit-associated GTPase HflX
MDLPHEIVPAFMTTLEHIKTADLILHVRDISHPQTETMSQTVKDVISTLGMAHLLNDTSKFIGEDIFQIIFRNMQQNGLTP